MDTLSNRVQQMGASITHLLKNFSLVQTNPYDDQSNPTGICNCGVAENYLCENELLSKLQSIHIWKPNDIYYPCPFSQLSARTALCQFLQRIFHLTVNLH